MQDKEIEVKIKVNDSRKLLNWLQNKARLMSNSSQTDHYFDPPHKSFLFIDKNGRKAADEYLRVRIDGSGCFFAYKQINHERALVENVLINEIETKVGQPDKIIKILKKLGFKISATIKKQRISYKYKEFQIDVDSVENLGDFVEIEYKGQLKNYKTGYNRIKYLLNEIGIGDWEEAKGGYVGLMLNK